MKVQIIQLEPHDDFISTRDKMGWSQTGLILLVWPPRGRILSRKLDLVLIQRHSKALGVKLAFVTSDSDVIYNADRLGLPVFNSVHQALESPWRGKRRKLRRIKRQEPPPDLQDLKTKAKNYPSVWDNHPGVRIGAFFAGLVAFFTVVSLFLPSARLTISPVRKQQDITLTVTGSPTFSKVNLTGELPLQQVTAIIEGKETITTTGKLLIPERYAIGGVRFTNLTEEAIVIPEGTIVSTLGEEPVRFVTTREGQLSAGVGRSLVLPTKALLPGRAGNVSAESILALEGPLGLSIAVINPMPTHNGTDKYVPAASAKDKTTLYNRLLTNLEKAALEEFKEDIPDGDILIDDSIELSEIIERIYNPPEGIPSNQIELSLRLQFEVLTVRASEIHNLANLILDANLPEGFISDQDTLNIRHDNSLTAKANGTLEWQMTLSRDIVAIINEDQAINLVLGLNSSQATQRLISSLELQDAPDISLVPNWWPRLPYLPFRVQVNQLGTH